MQSAPTFGENSIAVCVCLPCRSATQTYSVPGGTTIVGGFSPGAAGEGDGTSTGRRATAALLTSAGAVIGSGACCAVQPTKPINAASSALLRITDFFIVLNRQRSAQMACLTQAKFMPLAYGLKSPPTDRPLEQPIKVQPAPMLSRLSAFCVNAEGTQGALPHVSPSGVGGVESRHPWTVTRAQDAARIARSTKASRVSSATICSRHRRCGTISDSAVSPLRIRVVRLG